jgi:hypothetical protein
MLRERKLLARSDLSLILFSASGQTLGNFRKAAQKNLLDWSTHPPYNQGGVDPASVDNRTNITTPSIPRQTASDGIRMATALGAVGLLASLATGLLIL